MFELPKNLGDLANKASSLNDITEKLGMGSLLDGFDGVEDLQKLAEQSGYDFDQIQAVAAKLIELGSSGADIPELVKKVLDGGIPMEAIQQFLATLNK